jgi:transposase
MSEALLGRWVPAARAQATRPAGSEVLEQENKQLQAQLARAEMERDIFKKALTTSQMREAHFHKIRADETLRFHCLTRSLLARAGAVPSAGR